VPTDAVNVDSSQTCIHRDRRNQSLCPSRETRQ